MEDNPNIDSLEIIVRDNSGVPAPTAKTYSDWASNKLAGDAPALYQKTIQALLGHLEPTSTTDKDGVVTIKPVSLKAIELAADILKIRDSGGININQNFGGNTTINNNVGITVEDLIKRRDQADQVRSESRPNSAEIIDAEIVEDSASPDK